MIVPLLIGLGLGYFLSVPPGPIAVAVIKHALKGETREGLQIGVGAASMDTLYALGAILASTALVGTIKDAIVGSPWAILLFQVAAIITLVVMGFKYLKANDQSVEKSSEEEEAQEERVKRMGYSSFYVMGALISIANLASPTFFPTLVGVAGVVHSNDYVDNSIAQCAAYAVGFGGGAALWFVTLLRLLVRWRTRLSLNFISLVFKFAGWSFFLFAVILIVNIVLKTDWHRLF